MSNLPWDSPPGIAGDTGASDTEALQTDVMRFMAILALCLMAIFALVQSIPTLPEEETPQLRNRELLLSQIAELQRRVATLTDETATLTTAINKARTESRKTRQEARAQQARAKTLANQTRASQQAAAKALRTLKQTRAALQTQQNRLTELRAATLQARMSLRAVQRQIEQEQTESAGLQAGLREVREQMQTARAPRAPAEPVAAPAQGFTLRFASAEALQTLVGNGTVKFYAGTGSRYWQLRMTTAGPVFEPATGPRQLYEMTPSTVPDELVRAMQRSVATFDRNKVTWGVTLPATATAEIRTLMATHPGGILSIQADASVVNLDARD